jgi:LPPG:FO 2-phospho-L-lactate transferase
LILALAGGVGGAKLAQGLAMHLSPDALQIVVNTGDDFEHLGLHISPDIDTVMYWLAGINDRTRGWGLAGESWAFMEVLEQLGGATWFRLGDRDIATHVERTRMLKAGKTLSDVTQKICQRLGVRHRVAPMSDNTVRTIVHSDEGPLEFQHYFVRRQCLPRVEHLEFRGVESAGPSPAFAQALADRTLQAVIICPSNPLLSIDPVLAVPGVRDNLKRSRAPVVAVSPLIAGRAVKGPAAKIMGELGYETSSLGIARHYAPILDGIVIDVGDAALEPLIEAEGVRVTQAETLMTRLEDQVRLARTVLEFTANLT